MLNGKELAINSKQVIEVCSRTLHHANELSQSEATNTLELDGNGPHN